MMKFVSAPLIPFVLSLLCIITSGELLKAQEDTAYVRTYGGPYFEEGRQIIECAAGGYAVIGTTGSDVENNTNFYLLRLDANLECLWSKSLGGLEVEKGYSLVEDSNQNLLLCGYTNSEGAGGYDVLLIKTNNEGDEQWRRTYGGEDWDFGYKIIHHQEEGFLICGKTYSMGNGGSDGYLLHVDENGEIISEWTYGGEGDDEFVDVELTITGNYMVLRNATVNSNRAFEMVEIDYSGLVVWTFQKEFKEFESIGHSIEPFGQGFLISGSKISPSNEYGFFSILNENGNEDYYFSESPDFSFTYNKAIIQGDNVILPGRSNGVGAGGFDAVIYYFTLGYVFLGAPTYGGTDDEEFFDGILNSQGELISTGSYKSTAFSTQQLLVTRHTSVISGDYYQEFDFDGSCFVTEVDYVNSTTNQKRIKSIQYYNTLGQQINPGDWNLYSGVVFKVVLFEDNSSILTKECFRP